MATSNRGGRTWSRGPNKLSASYRARLQRAGITRESWLRGADLRAIRGHRPARPAYAAPEAPANRLLDGEATPADIATLERWRVNDAPEWLRENASTPEDLRKLGFDIAGSDTGTVKHRKPDADIEPISPPNLQLDVAGALSILPPPKRWGAITFVPRPDGQPWQMVVTPKSYTRKDGTVKTHNYDIVATIPGGGGKDTYGAREVLDWLAG